MFEKGVRYYTEGKLVLKVPFPEDQIYCRWCPWCRPQRGIDRHRCEITNEILYNIDFRGDGCPVEMEGMEER